METIHKGNATEAAVLRACIDHGLYVWLPFGGGHAADLIVELPTATLLRVQCKSARRSAGCLCFNTRSTDHGRGRLPYVGRAELFGTYCRDTGRVYLVPVQEASGFQLSLRLEPTRNNQRTGVRMAADYEISRWSLERLEAAAAPRLRRAPLHAA